MTRPAALGDAASARMLVQDDGKLHDVLEVVELVGTIARVRSPFLFEIGEELSVRIEQAGAVSEAKARVRAHTGPAEERVTELELTARSEPRPMVNG
ncbi:MAG: hypothetical protein H0T89_36155 [Deltaproteobacteria bacterium]|nr:hypothetical protein [Deltaproteobacteria bacterium]MDQ3300484.1 hypothetical protein [Myxococcota bacterium]